MKKIIFIGLRKERKRITLESLRTDTFKFTLGMLLALLLGWLVYPDFGLSKIETEVTVGQKIGGYTYYTYHYGYNNYLSEERFSEKKIIPEEKIGDKIKKDIKIKDHRNFKWDDNVETENFILIIYNAFLIVALIMFFVVRGGEDRYPPILSGLVWTSTIIDIIILTLYWA